MREKKKSLFKGPKNKRRQNEIFTQEFNTKYTTYET